MKNKTMRYILTALIGITLMLVTVSAYFHYSLNSIPKVNHSVMEEAIENYAE